jgi:phenylalanyl-tRNA synthetase beta chain
MHPVDIVEDVAIGYGYWRIDPLVPGTLGIGEPLRDSKLKGRISGLMIGAGFVEIMSYVLSSRRRQFRDLARKPRDFVKVRSPKSLENEIVRQWLIPGLLEVLRISKKETYPQRIFEIGTVARTEKGQVTEEEHLAAARTHGGAGYSDVKALMDTASSLLELDISVAETSHGSFIPGRVGAVLLKDEEIGVIGEISPEVLRNLQLDLPVAALELDLSSF